MFFTEKQCQLNLSVKPFRKKTKKNITTRFTTALILCATLGPFIPTIQAAQFSCTWGGGPGNWTDLNWTSDTGCSGVFPNNNGDTFDATLRTSIGAVTLDQDIAIQNFTFNGGTLTGPGDLTVNSVFSWTSGTMSGTGTTRANGGLELSGGLKDVIGGRNLVNGAGQVANWTEGSLRVFDTSQLVNEAGATFNVEVDGGRMSGSSAARFINAGNLVINLSDVSQNVQLDTPPLNNSGTVNVQTGELRLGGGGTSTGSFEVEANGRLNFSGGSHTLQAGSSVTGSNVDFSFNDSGGSTTIEGTYNVDNTTISGNAAIFNAVNSTTRTFALEGGFLDGIGDLTVTGMTTLSGGTIQGPGRLLAEGGLEIDGNFLTIVGDRRVLNGEGQVANWRSGGIGLNNTETRFENAENATFNIMENATMMTGSGGILGGVGEIGAFTNRGTVVVDRSDSASTLSIDVNFFNLGTIDLKGDKLAFGASIQQFDTGAILFDIGGPGAGEFDVLNIAELAILEGSFDLSLIDLTDPENNTDPFMPAIDDTFDILTAQIIFNEGLSLGGPDGGLFDFDIVGLVSGNQALRLTVAPVPIPATAWLFMSALCGILGIGIRKSK